MTRPAALAVFLAAALGQGAAAQVMSVSTSAVTLATPDTVAYDSGLSSAGAFSVMVTGCAGPLGCRVSIENPGAASAVPIELEWRLVGVSYTGDTDPGCVAVSALHSWQPLPASPVAVFDTGVVSVPGTTCSATIEVRAANVAYQLHQFTSSPTTYWRDLRFRTVEK